MASWLSEKNNVQIYTHTLTLSVASAHSSQTHSGWSWTLSGRSFATWVKMKSCSNVRLSKRCKMRLRFKSADRLEKLFSLQWLLLFLHNSCSASLKPLHISWRSWSFWRHRKFVFGIPRSSLHGRSSVTARTPSSGLERRLCLSSVMKQLEEENKTWDFLLLHHCKNLKPLLPRRAFDREESIVSDSALFSPPICLQDQLPSRSLWAERQCSCPRYRIKVIVADTVFYMWFFTAFWIHRCLLQLMSWSLCPGVLWLRLLFVAFQGPSIFSWGHTTQLSQSVSQSVQVMKRLRV